VPRFFNTAGPNNPDDHYTLPVLARLPDVRSFIDKKLYFVLHAPRQVGKHTAETGQVFLPEAVDRAFYFTQGQPWLVNALARQLTEVLIKNPAQAITAADVDRAKEILILRQDTHLDSLIERLREPRIKAIIEPMLAGDVLGDVPEDDRRFAVDLGLVRRTEQGGLDVANPIYREVIARVLASGTRDSLPQIAPTWLKPDGRLDPALGRAPPRA
jgi:hypothetical protein